MIEYIEKWNTLKGEEQALVKEFIVGENNLSEWEYVMAGEAIV